MNSRDKEKERLWKEVMNTRRPWQSDISSEQNIKSDSPDVDRLSEELKRDYGVQEEPPEKAFDSIAVFHEIARQVNDLVAGQEEAVQAFCTALRRPYVTGYEKGQARNVIVINGPCGSGKHEMIRETIHELYKRQIVLSKEINEIDLSRYSSSSQEQNFLQDLYEAFQNESPVVCFENFRSCYPGFLRMMTSLVTDGRILLNKRYVSNKGVLVENQTGLVKNATDHLSANDKYLIFINEGKISDVQDAFGASFLKHVNDVIELKPLDEKAIRKIIAGEDQRLKKLCGDQLKITLQTEESLQDWVLSHYEKDQGRNSIEDLYHDFYLSISEAVLKEEGKEQVFTATVKQEIPVLCGSEKEYPLSREKNSQQAVKAVTEELDAIVGLKQVKEYLHSLQANVEIQQRRKEQGLKTSPVSMHMIFTGNPGTGKTTVARLIARYMKAVGILSQGQLVEVTRSDLVARYVGQTAPLTMSVIHSALGGVLFIDEAYSLYRGKEDSFGLECIDTLVKAMEDHRDNLIVILAGYQKEMSVFLEANSGLKSRFPHIIEFPDYTGKELTEIAVKQASSKGYVIAEDARAELETYFDKVQKTRASEAGNGRLARNTVEDAILCQSERLVKESGDLSLLKKEDFKLK